MHAHASHYAAFPQKARTTAPRALACTSCYYYPRLPAAHAVLQSTTSCQCSGGHARAPCYQHHVTNAAAPRSPTCGCCVAKAARWCSIWGLTWMLYRRRRRDRRAPSAPGPAPAAPAAIAVVVDLPLPTTSPSPGPAAALSSVSFCCCCSWLSTRCCSASQMSWASNSSARQRRMRSGNSCSSSLRVRRLCGGFAGLGSGSSGWYGHWFNIAAPLPFLHRRRKHAGRMR